MRGHWSPRWTGAYRVWRERFSFAPLSPHARRVFRVCLLALLGAAVLYEIAMNAFLMTGALGRTLSFDEESFAVRYASAWSVIPGTVHAKGLYLRSKDSHVEFELRIDRCTFHAVLLELAKRRFHATSVHGEGVVFRARRLLAPDQENPRTIAALPPIEGLEAVPRLGPSPPPPDDAHYALWSAKLEHVEARSVRELWVDQIRFVGDADVDGGFSLRPIRWVTVGPATVAIRTGQVTRGDDVIASPLTGRVDVTIDGFDPRAIEGAEVLRFVNVHADVHALVPRLGFLDAFAEGAAGPPGPRFGGSGSAQADLRVVQGRLSSPSHVEVVADAMTVAIDRTSAAGRLRALVDIAGLAGRDTLDAFVDAREVRVVERGFEEAPLSADRAEVRLRSQKLDLADHPFDDAASSVALPSVQIPDARLVGAWVPSGAALRVAGGHGTCGAHFDLAGGRVHGNFVLGLDVLRVVEQDGWGMEGNLRVQLALRDWNIARGTLDVSGSHVGLADVSTTGGTKAWWARVDLPSAAVDVHPTPSFRTHVDVAARDGRPLASLFAAKSGVPDWLVPLFSTSDLRAAADLRASPPSVEVRDLVATAGGFRVEGSVAKRPRASRTLLLVELGPLAVAMDERDGDAHLQLLDAESWYHERAAAGASGR